MRFRIAQVNTLNENPEEARALASPGGDRSASGSETTFSLFGQDACNESIRQPDSSTLQSGHHGCDLRDLASSFGFDENPESPPDRQAELLSRQSSRSIVR